MSKVMAVRQQQQKLTFSGFETNSSHKDSSSSTSTGASTSAGTETSTRSTRTSSSKLNSIRDIIHGNHLQNSQNTEDCKDDNPNKLSAKL